MTHADSPDELVLQNSDTDVEGVGTPVTLQISDLGAVPGSELRKLTENVVTYNEGYDGAVYHDIYRR